MKPFRYIADPLFLLCLVLYPVNRLILKPFLPNTFSISWFNNLICIPFLIPIMLGVMRLLKIRRHDSPPLAHEMLVPLFLWSAYFEIYLPYTDRFRGLAFGDPVDIFFYSLGALIAILFWNWWYGTETARVPQ